MTTHINQVQSIYIFSLRPQIDIELLEVIKSFSHNDDNSIYIKDMIDPDERKHNTRFDVCFNLQELTKFEDMTIVTVCDPRIFPYGSSVLYNVRYDQSFIFIIDYYGLPDKDDEFWIEIEGYFEDECDFYHGSFELYKKLIGTNNKRFLAIGLLYDTAYSDGFMYLGAKIHKPFCSPYEHRRRIFHKIRLLLIWHFQRFIPKDIIRMIVRCVKELIPFIPLPQDYRKPFQFMASQDTPRKKSRIDILD